MNEQIYNDLKNALSVFGTQFSQALEKAGAATEVGYNIVKHRVIIESIMNLIYGVILSFFCVFVIYFFSIVESIPAEEYKKKYHKKIVTILSPIIFVSYFILLLGNFALIGTSLRDLFSPDYATIKRIVQLAKISK